MTSATRFSTAAAVEINKTAPRKAVAARSITYPSRTRKRLTLYWPGADGHGHARRVRKEPASPQQPQLIKGASVPGGALIVSVVSHGECGVTNNPGGHSKSRSPAPAEADELVVGDQLTWSRAHGHTARAPARAGLVVCGQAGAAP
jgi:hypothetical protein